MGPIRVVAQQAAPPILERETHLHALADNAHRAGQGQGRLVLVAGEAGVGKSTLLERFRETLPDAEWLEGACDSLFTPRPLGPLFDMAEGLGGELAEQIRTGGHRDTLFPALLERIASPHRLSVMVFEDIHWADEATLDLIRFLGRRLRDASTLVVVTYRDEAVAGHALLPEVLGDLARQRSTDRVELAPLSREAVERLCGDSGQDAVRLHRLTGGNPFFVSEVVRAGGATVPPSVRDAVLARVAPLSDSARNALEIAAHMGMRVEHTVLATVLDDPDEDLDELLGHGLVLSDGTSVRFRHELARVAIEDSVPAHRRGALHRRLLEALRAADTENPAQLAHHAEGCGDAVAVLDHAPRAAVLAARMGSHREAAAQYQRALRFADDAAPATRAALYDGLAEAHTLTDRFDQAADACRQARALWADLDDTRRLGDSMRRHGRALKYLGRIDDAREACEEAVRLLDALEPGPELARAYADLALLLMFQDRGERAIAVATRAQAVAGRLGLDDVMSDALNTEACSAATLGLSWREKLQESLALATSIGDAALVARAHNNTYQLLVYELLLDEADACFDEAVAHADAHDFHTYSRCLRGDRALSLLLRGRWDEAMAIAQGVTSEPGTSSQNWVVPRVVVALVAARRADDGAQEMLDEAREVATSLGQPQFIAPVHLARAEVAWLHGDQDAAWKELGLARDHVSPGHRSRIREIEVWAHRTGLGASAEGHIEAVRLELGGQPAAAARAWDGLACPYDAAMALLGSHEEAHLRESVIRFEALGATVPAKLARQRMRDHGYGAIPAGGRATTRAHPKGLTQREQEVLDLVATGMRNRDIAERLFLSPKTVAVHVSSIIRKLEVSTRTEAASWVHQSGSGAI